MTLKEEMDIAAKNGYSYIPPFKLGKISELSNKIVKLLTDNGNAVSLCYEDMKMVLELAGNIIDRGITKD